ncbi:MAG: DUF3089 domain-containing protein [Sphingomicrobium sp.]
MCARRFLIAIFILTLLAVAGAFAIFQFGQSVLISQATPKGHFSAPLDEGPDYSAEASWIAKPTLAGNVSTWLPEGFSPVTTPVEVNAAIFYVHPTTYLRTDRWNAPLDDAQSRDNASLFVKSQATALTSAGEVWAPHYRQAAFGAFLLNSRDAQAALNLAYSDVARAFDQFVKEAGDRPIILAGHSQGALHLLRLLKERGASVKGRLVAAYVGGWPVSTTADLPAVGLQACESAAQTGCLLSWMSFKDPANPDLVLKSYEGSAGLSGQQRKREDMLCVNPLTGTRNGTAQPSANLGTLVPRADLSSATIASGRVGATCTDGLLMINGDVPALGPYVLPGNNYHVYDYALFWASIRQDAARRAAAFAAR